MEKDQEMAWLEAQEVVVSVDLIATAQQQLEFLAAVDRRRWLYDGAYLDRAIHRYKNFWLPLLAKHSDCGAVDGSLYIPLDCEWIWHCHRLNPVQYKKDCEENFGRILNNDKVISSEHAKSKYEMTEKWFVMYPEEPFELDFNATLSEETVQKYPGAASSITYDLVSAVKRQSSFYYQVSRTCMHDKRFLEEALARYKGFLHLIKINQDRALKIFCVPSYDIDLMWHSHQLHSLSYCNDMMKLLGRVLGHDDTDSDRSKGKKLDVGFNRTTELWQDIYGLRYWKAGAMYKGNCPSPVISIPYVSNNLDVKEPFLHDSKDCLALPSSMVTEVLLEIVGIKNLPESQKGHTYVSFSKKKPDMLFYGGTLSIQSETGREHRASFKCEPTGELILALISKSNSKIIPSERTIGTTSISLQDLFKPNSKLSVENWFELKPHSGNSDSKPVCLHVAMSFTSPVLAHFELRMFKSLQVSTDACFLPITGKEMIKSWTRFLDHNGDEVIRLQIRNVKKLKGENATSSTREIIGISRLSGSPCLLAEYADNKWSLNAYNILLVENKASRDDYIFEIQGDFKMKLFPGKKLDYEPKCCKGKNADNFVTVVHLSAENPFGKAVALFDMKSGAIEINEERFVLFGVLLAFVLRDTIKRQGENALIHNKEGREVISGSDAIELVQKHLKGIDSNSSPAANGAATEAGSVEAPAKIADSVSDCDDNCNALGGHNSGGCGGCGSGGGCGSKATGCGSGCGGGCGGCGIAVGNMMDGLAGGCGGCGSGGGCGGCGTTVYGNMMDGNKTAAGSGGCGSGCGGGCGGCGANIIRGNAITTVSEIAAGQHSGGCGSGCGGGCGGCGANIIQGNAITIVSETAASQHSGGCGSSCGGGCGGCGANIIQGNAIATVSKMTAGQHSGGCGANIEHGNGNKTNHAADGPNSSSCGGCGGCGANIVQSDAGAVAAK